MPGKSSKSSSGKQWIWTSLVLLTLWAFWQVSRKGAILDYSAECGAFEAKINAVLSRHKITEKHVQSALHTERKIKFPIPLSWIETAREIDLPLKANVKELEADLTQACRESNLHVLSKKTEGVETIVELGRPGKVFQKIIFWESKGRAPYRAAIVIDDVAGRFTDIQSLDRFFSLKIPLTFAVLPMERITKEAAEKIKRAGHEIIVHQPMEPEDLEHNDPGKAALLVRMDADEIKKRAVKNFENVPYAVGINNHMGSRFTADVREMTILLNALKKIRAKNGDPVFFFDSRTNLKSVGLKIGKSVGLLTLQNDVFLDVSGREEDISAQLENLIASAKKHGSAVAIGHIQRKYLTAAIRKALPQFKKSGIRFVTLSKLLPRKK